MNDRNRGGNDDKPGSIDQAVCVCDSYIRKHRSSARFILIVLFCVTVLIGSTSLSIFYIYWSSVDAFPRLSSDMITLILLVLFAVFTLIFGVTMSIYRFHLNEISKMEHYKIGFLRIRIAANNISEGFQDEVRKALTESAFTFQSSSSGFKRPKKVDSPLPGHPGVDLTTIILNRLLDGVEIKPAIRDKNEKSNKQMQPTQ